MAPSYNRVILMGNLTREPDLKYTPRETAVVNLGLAVNGEYEAEDGKIIDETCFVDITVWGDLAEDCCDEMSIGSLIHIDGQLVLDQWPDKANPGKNKSRIRVRSDYIQCLDHEPLDETGNN